MNNAGYNGYSIPQNFLYHNSLGGNDKDDAYGGNSREFYPNRRARTMDISTPTAIAAGAATAASAGLPSVSTRLQYSSIPTTTAASTASCSSTGRDVDQYRAFMNVLPLYKENNGAMSGTASHQTVGKGAGPTETTYLVDPLFELGGNHPYAISRGTTTRTPAVFPASLSVTASSSGNNHNVNNSNNNNYYHDGQSYQQPQHYQYHQQQRQQQQQQQPQHSHANVFTRNTSSSLYNMPSAAATTTTTGYNPYTVSYPYPRKQDTLSSNHNDHHHHLKSLPTSTHGYFTSHFKEPCQQQYPYESCYTPIHFDDQRVNKNESNNNNNNALLLEECHLVDNHVDSAHDQEEALESVWNDFLLEDASLNHHHHATSHGGVTIKEGSKGRTKHNSSMTSPSTSFSSMLLESCLTDDNLHCTNSTMEEEQKMSKVSSLQSLVSKLEPQQQEADDDMGILSSFSMEITSLSMEPLSAHDILERVENRSQEVVTKYLPCVEFLVLCQQELRIGLDVATRSRGGKMGEGGGGYAMSTGQFYNTYFMNLPNRFYMRNKNIMPLKELKGAYRELDHLLADVRKMEKAGKYEGMKNAFLGGMRDGQSWGLRKWLSKNGGALNVCNDIELICSALKRQDKNDERIKELARRIRPKLRCAYENLKMDVPKAYQEVSSAHPYLPFFHRLESALKGLSEFDPEKEDIICLDDSDEEDESKSQCLSTIDVKKSIVSSKCVQSEHCDDGDSDVEIVAVIGARDEKPINIKEESSEETQDSAQIEIESTLQEQFWRCKICTYKNKISTSVCAMCDCKNDNDVARKEMQTKCSLKTKLRNKNNLVDSIDIIISEIEEGQEGCRTSSINVSDFWSNPPSNYLTILRSFREILLCKSSNRLIDPSSLYENVPDGLNKYYSLIKNPLGFRDIVDAMVEKDSDDTIGQLKTPALRKWNMLEGKWLIQAIDLVMLNALAFTGKESTPLRDEIIGLRKRFWSDIRGVGCPDKKQMPPKRTENSCFLLYRKDKV